MIYTIDKANLISKQLKKFTTGYTHHVVGHYSNIDFWFCEVKEALNTIDNHKKRFDNMYDTQKEWTENHGTIVHNFCPICVGKCEFSDGKPILPKFKYKTELTDTRKDLVDSAYYFLIRCFKIELLTYDELKEKLDLIGTSIDPKDLGK
jgi:hypothetical protein